jgi:hypothetical protein
MFVYFNMDIIMLFKVGPKIIHADNMGELANRQIKRSENGLHPASREFKAFPCATPPHLLSKADEVLLLRPEINIWIKEQISLQEVRAIN